MTCDRPDFELVRESVSRLNGRARFNLQRNVEHAEDKHASVSHQSLSPHRIRERAAGIVKRGSARGQLETKNVVVATGLLSFICDKPWRLSKPVHSSLNFHRFVCCCWKTVSLSQLLLFVDHSQLDLHCLEDRWSLTAQAGLLVIGGVQKLSHVQYAPV